MLRTAVNPTVRIQQLYLYQEAAGEHGSFFVEYPYRQINQSYAPTQAGFGDVNFGTKSLLFDCEMLQVAFQFRTFMPSGNFTNNLGTGLFALDPSILTSLKLGPTTYFQGQFGNWIPLGGPGVNRNLAGGIFYWLMSVNQTLWYMTPDSPLIATLEMDGWSFEDGGYTTRVGPRLGARAHIPRAKPGTSTSSNTVVTAAASPTSTSARAFASRSATASTSAAPSPGRPTRPTGRSPGSGSRYGSCSDPEILAPAQRSRRADPRRCRTIGRTQARGPPRSPCFFVAGPPFATSGASVRRMTS